jgi:hypothetical protein
MEKGWLSPHTLFTIATTLTLVGYLLKVYIDYWYQDKTAFGFTRSGLEP